MLYPTLSQPLVFLAVFGAGLAGGLIFDIFKILTFLSGNDRYSKIFFDFLATILSFGLLFVVNLAVNYGQFRIYVLLSFLLSLLIERLLSKFLWTKCIRKCYNRFREKHAGRKKEKNN